MGQKCHGNGLSKFRSSLAYEEERCLVTLDLDFSNPLSFDPTQYSGIAVLQLPNQASHQDLLDAILTLIGALDFLRES
ncbi:DUF5615 family PIN-like protein, partial [Thermoleptolyngbya sp.]